MSLHLSCGFSQLRQKHFDTCFGFGFRSFLFVFGPFSYSECRSPCQETHEMSTHAPDRAHLHENLSEVLIRVCFVLWI